MCAAGFKMAGLPEQQGCHECHDQRGSQEIKGVAEGQDVSLGLYDMTDRDHRTMRCVGLANDAVVHEILRQLVDPGAGGLFQQRYRLHQHVGVILFALGEKGLQHGDADGAAEVPHHVEQPRRRAGILGFDA